MKEISLNGKRGKDKVTSVDDEDYERLSKNKWHIKAGGYVTRTGNKEDGELRGKEIYMHREIMGFPDGMVDHIDQNKLNNCKSNLRICNASQNTMNRSKFNQKYSSSYKGVSYDKNAKKWRAQIIKDKKRIHIGWYKTEIEAGKAYNEKAIELYGEFACLNKL